jgi:hypothetical protein
VRICLGESFRRLLSVKMQNEPNSVRLSTARRRTGGRRDCVSAWVERASATTRRAPCHVRPVMTRADAPRGAIQMGYYFSVIRPRQ